jgi:hypothetical protein
MKAPANYSAALWGGFLVLIGAAAWILGMAIHNARAALLTPRPEPIYYCAMGVEMPEFEPCKEMEDQRDI